MSKYWWLGLSITLMVVLTAIGVHFGIGAETAVGQPDIDQPEGILAAFDFIGDSLSFIWQSVTFQLTDIPVFLNALLAIPAYIAVFIVISLIRGTE